jgi:TrpR-related protein YerC/YecD
MEKFDKQSIERFFNVILNLNTVDECYKFFEDVCTVKELQDMGQRLDVALMLNQGKNYNVISAEVGASSATISRVNKCLMYGTGGYALAIKKLKGEK